MAKKIREIEVEYPDCMICGNEIPTGRSYFILGINMSRMILGENGGSSGVRSNTNQHPLIFCEDCSNCITSCSIKDDVNTGTTIARNILMEIEKQRREQWTTWKKS